MAVPANQAARDIIIRPDLNSVAEEFDLAGNVSGMAGLKIFKPVLVKSPAMRIKKRKLAALLKKSDTKRAAGGAYNKTNSEFDQDSYVVEENGLEEAIDDGDTKLYGETKAEQNAAKRVWHGVCDSLNDQALAKIAALPGGQKTAAATPWSDYANATPIDDVDKGIRAFKKRTGMLPTSIAFDWETYRNLLQCEQILARFNKNNTLDAPMTVNIKALAVAFDVSEVVVNGAVQNQANEAKAPDLVSAWDVDTAMLYVALRGDDISVPHFASNMVWTEDAPSNAVENTSMDEMGTVFETYYCASRRSKIVRNRVQFDQKVWRQELAQLITDLVP